MFEGVYTAIVTPFAGGEVDYGAFEKLIEWQIESGVDGIVPCGTTGESATLTEREHAEVVDFTVRRAKGRVKVIAGTGSNCTRTAIELTLEARKSGADGALLVSPYYNKPTPEGLYQHYLAVSEATPLPLVIYNVPGRTGRNVPAEVVERLAQRENIVAVKEASGDLGQISRLAANTALTILSGDDGLTLPILSVGGRGVISVASNVVPVEMRALVESYLAGDPDKALAVHRKLLALFKALFVETNPIPVKAALAAMGRISEEYRLPLVSMKEENRLELVRVLEKLGLVHATGG
jgi:4-hydroxy-tetrahydrodipicolinate synthase